MGNCGRRQCEFAAPIVAMECDAGILLVAKRQLLRRMRGQAKLEVALASTDCKWSPRRAAS